MINPLKTSRHHQMKDSNILLIRHAESMFNCELKHVKTMQECLHKDEFKTKWRHVKFTDRLIDCDITEAGHKQCIDAGKQLSDVNVKYIFVSPMKRTLLTCLNVLRVMKESKNSYYKSEIPEVIVHPVLFEKVEDNCDILGDVHRNMKDFNKPENIMYNWGMFGSMPHLPIYQLKYLDVNHIGNHDSEYFFSQAQDRFTKQNQYNHIPSLLEAMEVLEAQEKFIESSKMTIERLSIFKKFLHDFMTDKKNKMRDDEKILVIGHSVLFKHLLCSHVHEDTLEPTAETGVLNNCEITGISFKN